MDKPSDKKRLPSRGPQGAHIHSLYKFTSVEPVICKYFGCGKTLTPEEKLYGPCCIDHTGMEVLNKTLITFLSLHCK